MNRPSPQRSRKSPPRNIQSLPRECANLLWTDLESLDADGARRQRALTYESLTLSLARVALHALRGASLKHLGNRRNKPDTRNIEPPALRSWSNIITNSKPIKSCLF
jgi:hypothetical protein